MPMKAAVREMLPPKRRIWALRYSRSNTSRASLSGKAMIRSAPTAPADPDEVTSAGSISAVISSDGSPETRISRRSTILISWRTLPGQGCTWRVAMASSPSRRLGSPVAALIRSTK